MLICIVLNGLMLEVGTVMWLFGLFDVVCSTLKLAFIAFFFFFFLLGRDFPPCRWWVFVVSERWLLVGAGLYLERAERPRWPRLC